MLLPALAYLAAIPAFIWLVHRHEVAVHQRETRSNGGPERCGFGRGR